jgi:hypothetical protein
MVSMHPEGMAAWEANSSFCVVANEAFHYWRVKVEARLCEVVICA